MDDDEDKMVGQVRQSLLFDSIEHPWYLIRFCYEQDSNTRFWIIKYKN